MSWLEYASKKVEAQGAIAGLGLPGGFHPYTFNLSDSFGGPRWYPWQYDGNFENLLRDQYRYNPEYIPIGDQAAASGTGWQKIAELTAEDLGGKKIKNLKVFIVPERHEKASIVIADENASEFKAFSPSLIDKEVIEDICKRAKAWDFVMQEDDGGLAIYAKNKEGGSENGIFTVNGPAAVPGPHFIWRDGPSATPSNSAHGDTKDNEWANWRQNSIFK